MRRLYVGKGYLGQMKVKRRKKTINTREESAPAEIVVNVIRRL
jgi:hypothetical protein